jgi:hypothetical protein
MHFAAIRENQPETGIERIGAAKSYEQTSQQLAG